MNSQETQVLKDQVNDLKARLAELESKIEKTKETKTVPAVVKVSSELYDYTKLSKSSEELRHGCGWLGDRVGDICVVLYLEDAPDSGVEVCCLEDYELDMIAQDIANQAAKAIETRLTLEL